MNQIVFKGTTLGEDCGFGIVVKTDRRLDTSDCTEDLIRSCWSVDETLLDSWSFSDVLKKDFGFVYKICDENSPSKTVVTASYEKLLSKLTSLVSNGCFTESVEFVNGQPQKTTVSYDMGNEFDLEEVESDEEDEDEEDETDELQDEDEDDEGD